MENQTLSAPIVILTCNTSWYLYNFRRKTIISLRGAGMRVICLAPQDAFSDKLVIELGAEHIPLPLDGKGTRLLQELYSFVFIYKALRHYRPDFVFNFTVKLNVYAGLACTLHAIPFANNISGLGTAFLHDKVLYRLVRRIYGLVNRRAQRLFFQNEADLAFFREGKLLRSTPVTVLPGSGVNLVHFAYSSLPAEGPFTFIMIARLLGDKGVREYAEACRRLQQQGMPARCLLVGPLGVSNHSAIPEREVKAWHEEGILEYLGETEDVRPFIAIAHVLVLPSYREGMPRTVLEAAAMGRPAIVTDVPGCRHAILPGVTGWLCNAKSVESLTKCMTACVTMGRTRIREAGIKARDRMEEHFSEDIVVQAYLDCLASRKHGSRMRMSENSPG